MADAAFDMTAISAKHTAPQSASLLKKRHWAEVRLKAYGILAIFIAAAALATLLYTVVGKTLGILYEYNAVVTVQMDLSEREMRRIEDPNPRLVPKLDKPVRAGLTEVLGAEGLDRRGRRAMNALLSTDAGLELGAMAKDDPSIIGSEIQYQPLFDDQVQLYLKGDLGRLKDAGTDGTITITAGEAEGEVVITTEPQAMTEARLALRERRAREARVARRTANDQARAYDETTVAIGETTSDEERAALEAQLEQFKQARDAANAIADRAMREATNTQNVFALSDTDPSLFLRVNGGWIKVTELAPERLRGEIYDAPGALGEIAPGDWEALELIRPEAERKLNDRQILWLENLRANGQIEKVLNTRLIFKSDSSNAELAGIWGALVGSFWTMVVTFLLAFPIGVCASIYLEEFAPKNKITDFIEVNINNLAAVPSIVFGLLGITVLISGVKLFGIELFDGLLKSITEDPRSTPLAGGVVLALMSLPTIIIAARASIKAVPPSIRDAALGLGASKLQTSTHHVLPLAMPGILTGSIIAMAQALGETAPLIIVGMNAFIQDPPGDPLDKANVLPSLIYLWNNNSERLFDGKTAMAITVLLVFLVLMNALAVVLRKRFERRW
ncbi:MAG: phosphate ABC transporter permease PstA [Pseudomonadota bacterium]